VEWGRRKTDFNILRSNWTAPSKPTFSRRLRAIVLVEIHPRRRRRRVGLDCIDVQTWILRMVAIGNIKERKIANFHGLIRTIVPSGT
jgi:hypothetical protein